jgi:hypothetical protein
MCKRSEGLSFQIENKKEKQKDVQYCFIANFTKSGVSSVVHSTDVSSVTDATFKCTYKSVLRDIKPIAFVTESTYQKFLLHAHFTTCLCIYVQFAVSCWVPSSVFEYCLWFDVCKSVHHYTIQINQSTRCNSFTSLLVDVQMWLNMFRTSLRPSSGAYNCTRSLWFYR